MKIVKPLRLGIMSRPYYDARAPHLGIAVLALAEMGEKPQLRPEPELWQLAQSELSRYGGIVDLAYPKHYAEFLAAGYAWPHTCQSENTCRVSITLGEKQKSLLVSGDRERRGNSFSAPRPFSAMPLDWSRTYGGPHFPDNPLGMGAPETDSDETPRPLPNVSYPGRPDVPAGFGPLDLGWPARQAFIGTQYDDAWVQRGSVGFADDMDPRLFNMAPADQQWNAPALPPGLAYRIENMHPEKARLEGMLPSWLARCFVHHTHNGEECFSEIALQHTTVWFLPHQEKMILVYHGKMPLEDDDAHDVHMLMPVLDAADAPRPAAHYRDVWVKRSDKEKGSAYAFQDADLVPEDAIGPWLDTEMPPVEPGPLEQNINARRQGVHQETEQRLQAVNSTLPEGVKDAPEIEQPTLSQLPAFMAQMEEKARKAKEEAMQEKEKRIPDTAEYDARRLTGPESFYKICDALRQQQGELLPGQEEQMYQLYRLGVPAQNPAPRLTGNEAIQRREWIIGKLAQDRNFTGCDLTGADLSHLDLSGANFTRAMLESADLSHAILDEATLVQTLLARTKMDHTSLRKATLTEATLALADCADCDFTGATLHNLILEGARFKRCNFSIVALSQQMFEDIELIDCDFSNASLDNAIFNGLTLEKTRFTSACLHKVSFIDSHLRQAVFGETTLRRCAMTNCRTEEIDFTRARLENCAFAAGTRLEKACFVHAALSQCNLRQTPLMAANFNFAALEGCDFSEASLVCATLRCAQANGARFIRTDLTGADLSQARLMGSLLHKARLTGCDFTAANLFRADLSQAETDDTTIMRDAWIKQMKVSPSRKGVTG
ncbi:DUF2169 family type VI secretion system accessory protein [Enterobacillus tribolii]|uniref:Uncharacterized protein YjbI with pentapeptide repeats n=1 Tax=Enterobacillus tribolii TaxID=1487935 RepID=A0A370QS74_9GAMM|nr:DUF2169 domain-containing protein [Enterobacillus tribolii]MBW7983722.1 DUF2169 domain-containing protein [Enterobacillus tribolii]RDK92086.1 uncharacterized protein YjbI with pentapeptide repeats [Enterobacillus tribolii]